MSTIHDRGRAGATDRCDNGGVTTDPAPAFTRPALAPGLLAAIALLAGLALLSSDWFLAVRFVVSILALIMCVFAIRGRAWWTLPLLAAIAILWNPVIVVPLEGEIWQALQFIGALVTVVTGVFIRVPTDETILSSHPKRG